MSKEAKQIREWEITTIRELKAAAKAVNTAAFQEFKAKNTCIQSSYALRALLRCMGYRARLARVTARFTPKNPDSELGACILGSEFPHRARSGEWCGHLAVLVENRWIVDSTADQANERGLRVRPVVVELNPEKENGFVEFEWCGCEVYYHLHYSQTGFYGRSDDWIPVFKQADMLLQSEGCEV